MRTPSLHSLKAVLLDLTAMATTGSDGGLPGLRALLDDLRRAGIASVLGRGDMQGSSEWHLAAGFGAVAGPASSSRSLSPPDDLASAARLAGAAPHECVVIASAAAGISGALDGGFVAVGMGNADALGHAHRTLGGLKELDVAGLIELHARFRPDRWCVVAEGIDLKREGARGTVFCVGNGFFGVRGSLPGAGAGIFVAGFYDRINRGRIAPETWSPFLRYWGVPELARDEQIEVCIVDCPDFLSLELVLDGQPLSWNSLKILGCERRLDLHAALFTARVEYETPEQKRLALTQRRFADAVHPERVFSQYVFEAVNFTGRLGIRSQIVGQPVVEPSRLYEVVACAPAGERGGLMRIRGARDGVHAAFGGTVRLTDSPHTICRVRTENGRVELEMEAEVEPNRLLRFEHAAVGVTGRHGADIGAACREALTAAEATPFAAARVAHGARWREYWERSDVRIEGNSRDQLGLRFGLYHLLLSASTTDATVSIPAKGLSGNGYRGMVFWDTDIHMLPFFTYTQPAIARRLAMFRCLTLEGAREKAARYGGRGASYPWETGVSGREECEKWLRLITHQLHITADIAFAVQEYADITGDTRFYEEHAAEVLIETARFWMSRTRRNEDGSLSIPQAGGPDEFHVVCDDSAYILHMAAHNLRLADRAVCHLRRNAPEILARILETNGIAAMELDGFGDAANRLRAMRSATGLVEQCAGFFRLRDGIDGRDGGPRPFETQCVKQADVLMLPYLLPDQWDNAAIRVNFAYYEPRTVHGSSLSAGVHGILAARLGLRKVAEGYIHPLLGMDLDDARSDTAYGAHMAASGMNWSAIVRGYAGCRPRGDVFLIERSLLPPDWTRLTFRLLWRGADFEVDLRPGQVTVANREGAAPLPLDIAGERLRVMPGQVVTRGVAA